jgi:hydrogenase maturation protein HypF
VVQGVGFRPYIYGAATALGLDGWVRNDSLGVLLEVEGEDAATVGRFLETLGEKAPPLASIESISIDEIPATGVAGFAIRDSERSTSAEARVAADAATCGACLRELFDPADRRFRYPFINCTDCGPRFTIVTGVPYDRPLTTMAGFVMCPTCRAEYEDPLDRRFHAQPNACAVCGPAVQLLSGDGEVASPQQDPVTAAAAALRDGQIVAIKGLGGFHLACRADDEAAVARLRERKHREDRPFALMAANVEAARELVFLGKEEERLLRGRERPIVLARRHPAARVADAVAPRHRDLGVMLPYSPLHHLLLRDVGVPLVMTSGNVSDEPIAYRNEEATERLGSIADAMLLHDRPIQTRTDDSVLRAVSIDGERRPLMLRRSRGYVPSLLRLPLASPRPLLACGAELKNTFCMARGERAWLGPHIGDLRNYESLRSFRESIEHYQRCFELTPEVVVHDLHPEYLSTKYALERSDLEALGVQHHHAHLAACLAEHGEAGPALGAIYDGTGYGTDETVWGGEILWGDLLHFERVAHLWPVHMPGGEAAVREPWRMACAWLAEALGADPPLPERLVGTVPPKRWEAVSRLLRSGVAAPLTSSMGRLFDAVAALCAVRASVTYEGQAAIELELAADPRERGAYPLPLLETGNGRVLDARETIVAVQSDLREGTSVAAVAARFHNAVAHATARVCRVEAERRGTSTVVLSGGVFQNVLLLERTAAALSDAGLRPLIPRQIPPNDGGISYGQAAIAAATLKRP